MLGRGSHLGTWCFDLRDEPRRVPSLTGLGFHLCHTGTFVLLSTQACGTATSGIWLQRRSPYEATFQGEPPTALGPAELFSASRGPEPQGVLITSPPVTRAFL